MKRDEIRVAEIRYNNNLSHELVRRWIIGLCQDDTINEVKYQKNSSSIDLIVRECALHWLNVVRSKRQKNNQNKIIKPQKTTIPISLAHIPPRKLAPELCIDLIPENFEKFSFINSFPISSSLSSSFSSSLSQSQSPSQSISNSSFDFQSQQLQQLQNNNFQVDNQSKLFDSLQSKSEKDPNTITDEDIILIENEVNELYSKLTDKSFSSKLTLLERKELSSQLEYYADLLENLSKLSETLT